MKKRLFRGILCLTGILSLFFESCKPLGPVRVACVGDSNTAGTGVANREKDSYPAKLQLLAGDKWLVKNFGTTGSCVIEETGIPYTGGLSYRETLEFNPDIIILALGWNDLAKKDPAFIEEHFVEDYSKLIKTFSNLPSRPKIILLLMPLSGTEENNYGYTYYLSYMKQVAEKNRLPLLDLFPGLSKERNLFAGDSYHLNREGCDKLAAEVFAAVSEVSF